ncbi:endonuclease/exonuclease/phosphatase family protein [Prosthecobacter sp.]|uniref:endonuclease/exonuclease/phosphatase family protein n=1 Tax=Prosthecobacter sp. TaxID=1965333 RepID=UPI003784E21D
MKRLLKRLILTLLTSALLIAAAMAWNVYHTAIPEPTTFAKVTPPPAFTPLRLRVVTWNLWGIFGFTPRRAERMQVIAREIVKLNPDIVGFQEVFVQADRDLLTTALREAGLPHSRYFSSGLVGSGLLLVSRFPIESDGFIRYADGGRPEAVHHGDWWAGKGLSLSTLRLPDGSPLYIANTHMHARYRGQYHATQLAQGRQLLPWASRVKDTGAPALWLGDWNNKPDSDVLAPLIASGDWRHLTGDKTAIDHIFGSGPAWQWHVLSLGKLTGLLTATPKVPWSDHAARWIEVELRRQP